MMNEKIYLPTEKWVRNNEKVRSNVKWYNSWFDDCSLNVMKVGHHYQLLNMVDQRILNQCRMRFVALGEWVVI